MFVKDIWVAMEARLEGAPEEARNLVEEAFLLGVSSTADYISTTPRGVQSRTTECRDYVNGRMKVLGINMELSH